MYVSDNCKGNSDKGEKTKINVVKPNPEDEDDATTEEEHAFDDDGLERSIDLTIPPGRSVDLDCAGKQKDGYCTYRVVKK